MSSRKKFRYCSFWCKFVEKATFVCIIHIISIQSCNSIFKDGSASRIAASSESPLSPCVLRDFTTHLRLKFMNHPSPNCISIFLLSGRDLLHISERRPAFAWIIVSLISWRRVTWSQIQENRAASSFGLMPLRLWNPLLIRAVFIDSSLTDDRIIRATLDFPGVENSWNWFRRQTESSGHVIAWFWHLWPWMSLHNASFCYLESAARGMVGEDVQSCLNTNEWGQKEKRWRSNCLPYGLTLRWGFSI